MNTMIEKLSRLLVWICSIALVLMAIQVTLDVAGKYAFDSPIPGSETIVASYYMIAIVFLPLAFIELRDEAIVVELFYNAVNAWSQKTMRLLAALSTTVCYIFLAWALWEPAMHAYRIGEFNAGTWNVVVWPGRFLLPLGLGLGALVAFLRFVLIAANKEPPADPEHDLVTDA